MLNQNGLAKQRMIRWLYIKSKRTSNQEAEAKEDIIWSIVNTVSPYINQILYDLPSVSVIKVRKPIL